MGAPTASAPNSSASAAEPTQRRAARYAWAQLLARIYEVFPLRCPNCGGEIRIIAFITHVSTVRAILAHLGNPDVARTSASGPLGRSLHPGNS